MLRIVCLMAVASAAVCVPVEDASAQGLRRRGMRARMVERRQSTPPPQQVVPQTQTTLRQAVVPNGWQPVQNVQQFVPQNAQQIVPNPTRIITRDGRQFVQGRWIQQGGQIIQGNRVVQNGWIEDGVNQVGAEIVGNASGALIGAAGGLAEGLLRSIVPVR